MEMQGISADADLRMEGQGVAEPSSRLLPAAHEFEGQMLKELLKPMMDSGGLGGSDTDSEVLGEFGLEALGKALSEQGGFGIARQIIAQFSRSGNQSQTESVTREGYFSNGMNRFQ